MVNNFTKRLMNPVHFFYPGKHNDSSGLLLPSLDCFPCLYDLDLICCNLSQVPDAIQWLHCFGKLNLGGNNLVDYLLVSNSFPNLHV